MTPEGLVAVTAAIAAGLVSVSTAMGKVLLSMHRNVKEVKAEVSTVKEIVANGHSGRRSRPVSVLWFGLGFVAGVAALVMIAVEPDMRSRRRWG